MKNEQISVDMETGDEYTWKDVIITEEDMPEADKKQNYRRDYKYFYSQGSYFPLFKRKTYSS